jgi:hypothetical protein
VADPENDGTLKTSKATEALDRGVLCQRCYTSALSIIRVLKAKSVAFFHILVKTSYKTTRIPDNRTQLVF